MAYSRAKLISDLGGKEEVKRLIEVEYASYDELREILGLPTISRRILQEVLKICEAEIPYKHLTPEARKWKKEWNKYDGNYWESEYIVNILNTRLQSPTINKAGSTIRYVISCMDHPRASKNNSQVKAHIVKWEIANKCYLDTGMELSPKDGSYTNLELNNYVLISEIERKSKNSTGSKNYFYVDGGGNNRAHYSQGWEAKSKKFRNSNNICASCNTTKNLVVHHIIPYRVFSKEDKNVHNENNLITLCQSCHGKVHSSTIQIKPLISEMKYEKLLELLENLKSLASGSTRETLIGIEQQLKLTDNQQPSS